ncbi:MAG: hypothetical protein QOG85_212 [Gaiellaceae bacterium]|nr:hypothetical protein [Gaiellaceae bacterium]
MNEIRFHVDGDPRPQPKKMAFARKTPSGGVIARVYDTGGANGWKALVAEAAKPHRLAEPIACPIRVDLRFYFRRPDRLMTRNVPDGELPHLGKFDVDNLTKAIFDTLTQLGLWRDDKLVYRLFVEKYYAAKGGRPGMDATITWESDAQPWLIPPARNTAEVRPF